MFYLNETLDAAAAHNYGLITKIIDGDFDKELMTSCSQIAALSSQVSRSPVLKRLVPDAVRSVHEPVIEKLRLHVLHNLRLVSEISTIVHRVARTALVNETIVESCEPAELFRLTFVELCKKIA